MLIIFTILISKQIICLTQGSLLDHPEKDSGTPLYLTPYVESGKTAEGKRLARVPFTDKLNIKSYAGYITVNKKYDSNMFFWYFTAMKPYFQEAPVITWLQGGPGSSSMYGLFVENGPLRVVNDTIKTRQLHWALNHHIIYIDNPVGTGFSFTNSSEGYCTDEVQVGDQLYSMMYQFFQLFPELQRNKYFLTGESYAGKYVPALAYAIHKNNAKAKMKINLKGLAIGNGWIDPVNMLVYDKYVYQIGLIDWNAATMSSKYQQEAQNYIRLKQFDKAYDCWKLILWILQVSQYKYNYLLPEDETTDRNFKEVLNKAYIKKDLHVKGDLVFQDRNNDVYNYLKFDVMQSVAPWLSKLLEHYSVLLYNGQLDIIAAYPLTVNFLRNLNFPGAEEYKTAERHVWKVNKEVAGFVKQAGNLTEILVRNAGHMVPKDQPEWALDLITKFTHNMPFFK